MALAPALRDTRRVWTIRVREGFRMQIDGSSQTGRMLYATGEYESETTRIVTRFLAPGDTMIDVGANIGYFTILGARRVGPRGRVVAFEPVGRVRERLTYNLQLNDLTNVTVRDEALSAQSGAAEFFTGPQDDSGLASLRPLAASTRVSVMRARLDDLWDADQPIALIKIDVEGAEMAALEGMAGCLTRHSPDVIVEVTDEYLRALGASAAALVGFLTGQGYSMYRIDHDRLAPVAAAGLGDCPSQFNAFFTKRPLPGGRLRLQPATGR
ncbi:MAG: FkbM family methyltransferase [Acidobacteria bacterium]|nr:FkbM family methyltransferase [Acidobacteriota bacterium]